MSVQNNQFPEYLENYAVSDSWNSYISVTDKPEDVLKNGFTEVGLFTRIFEALKEAFGLESKMSKKALGARLVTVIETLEKRQIPLNEHSLNTLMKIAKRAQVYGNSDSQKDYPALTQKFNHLRFEPKQLVAPTVVIVEESIVQVVKFEEEAAPEEVEVIDITDEATSEEANVESFSEQVDADVTVGTQIIQKDDLQNLEEVKQNIEKVKQNIEEVKQTIEEVKQEVPASKSYSSTAWKLATCTFVALAMSAASAFIASSKPTCEDTDEDLKWAEDVVRKPCVAGPPSLKWAENVVMKPCVAGPKSTYTFPQADKTHVFVNETLSNQHQNVFLGLQTLPQPSTNVLSYMDQLFSNTSPLDGAPKNEVIFDSGKFEPQAQLSSKAQLYANQTLSNTSPLDGAPKDKVIFDSSVAAAQNQDVKPVIVDLSAIGNEQKVILPTDKAAITSHDVNKTSR